MTFAWKDLVGKDRQNIKQKNRQRQRQTKRQTKQRTKRPGGQIQTKE